MSTGVTNGRRRDAADMETMDGDDDAESEEHTPPLQHAPTEEELAYRTDLITIEAQQHLDGWDEDDLQLFLELLEDAGTELQREMLNRAVAMGHSPTELHSFGDSIRGITDEQLFQQCTPPADMPVRTSAQMELRLRAEADPFLAFQINRAPKTAPPPPGQEPKTVPQSEVVQQAVQQTAKAGLKVQFSLSQSYDGSRPIGGPPEPTGLLPVQHPPPAAPKGDPASDSVLRPRATQQGMRLPAALEAKAPAAAPPPAASPAPAGARPPMPGLGTGAPPVSAPRGTPAGQAVTQPSPIARAPGPAAASAPPPAAPAAAAAAPPPPAPKKEERKGFADDLFNDALKPFGLTLDEHVLDDEKLTVEKVLAAATESLLKGLPVPVVLGSAKGDHRRYALMLQVVMSPQGRSFQVHDPFAQETVWINDTDFLGLSQLGFSEKTHKRITAIALAKALSGKLA